MTVQVMHIGPYATEPVTIERMKAFMQENGYRDRVGIAANITKFISAILAKPTLRS